MNLELKIPEEFYNKFGKSLQVIYSEAVEQARRDMAISKEYLTFPEAMAMFDISRATLNAWTGKGLSMYQIEGKRYVRRSEVENWINKHKI